MLLVLYLVRILSVLSPRHHTDLCTTFRFSFFNLFRTSLFLRASVASCKHVLGIASMPVSQEHIT